MAYDLEGSQSAPASSPFIPVIQLVVDIVDLLVRRWWIALIGPIVGGLIGHHLASKMPDTFSASATMMVDEGASQTGGDPNDILAERRMALQRRVEAVRSIPVADTVHRILTGKIDPKSVGATGGLGSIETAPSEEGAPQKLQEIIQKGLDERLRDPAYLSNLLAIRGNVQISADVDASMLTISASGTNPGELAAKPNAYYQAYAAHCLAAKTAHDRRMLRATESALARARQALARAEGIENAFRRTNRLGPRGRGRRPPGAAAPGTGSGRRVALAGASPGVGTHREERGDKSIAMRQNLLAACLRELDQLLDLEEELSGSSPAVTAKQMELLGLFDTLAESDGSVLQPKLPSRAGYEQYLAESPATPGPEVTASALEQTVTIADAVYSGVLSQQRELQVRIALTQSEVHLVEPATTPTESDGPDRSRVVRKGALMGFALVFLLLLLHEYGDARVKGVAAVTRIAGAPVLATFPFDAGLDSRPSEERIVVQEGSFTPLAEAMRELRTRLVFTGAPSAGKTLLITSAFSGDGKTFVASNLAVALAQVGERVLLVDGDLRKPRLHEVFGVPNSRGFSDLSDASRIHELVRTCMLPNLHLLTAGPPISAPAEFLSRGRTQEILRALLAQYDRLIFDTPPINLVADASNLATLADFVVLVIRDGGCTESELAAAAERVKRSHTRLGGVVLNHVRQPMLTYGGRYGYGYGYGRTDSPQSDRRSDATSPP